ncbi:hypothetical protein NE562_13135 [Butyricicoccus faecihominis]|uniref:hypothetical protein n=1 Tax=Butyricicoccus faecihominis TaxID=1712515 RepID=UPI00247AF14E|nr:hypothetical protein [Butyricicoccus faecihominis]MCQ5130610.1 hypothetical protein [Butyricicoccus faecihominis]
MEIDTKEHIPDDVIASLARAAAPAILAYFSTDAGCADYTAWRQMRSVTNPTETA